MFWRLLPNVIIALGLVLASPPALAEKQSVDGKDLASKDLLTLKGPWEFFWGELIEPEDSRHSDLLQEAGRSWTPPAHSNWRKGEGFASYRLHLQNLQPLSDGYSLAIRGASTALKLYLYPKGHPEKLKSLTVGQLGRHVEEEIPQLRAASLNFFPAVGESEWVLIVQVSNFHYSRGGLWTTPILGRGKAAENRLIRDRELWILCFGMIVVIGVYNLSLYARRRQDRSSLMLALFCAVVALRSSASDNMISWYFPQVHPWIYSTKYLIEYLTMILGPLTCITFIHLSFKKTSLPRCYRGVLGLSLGTGLLILVLDNYQRSLVVVGIQCVTALQLLFGMSVLVRSVLARAEEAWLSAIGGFILTLCVLYDIMITFDLFPQPYITPFGMTIFVFLQSQVVAKRFSKAFHTAEHLSIRLREEVDHQTQELRSIMENIPQGVFMMLADRTIQGNYSRELERILGQSELAGKPALNALLDGTRLSGEELSIIDSILLCVLNESLSAWEMNAHALPAELHKILPGGGEQVLEIEWHPILGRDDGVDRILVTVRNVTDVRILQASERRNQEAFDRLLEVVQVSPRHFNDFLAQSGELLQSCFEPLNGKPQADSPRKILGRLHTWKGLARALQFRHLAARIHEAEQTFSGLTLEEAKALPLIRSVLESLQEILQAYQTIGNERLGYGSRQSLNAESTPETRELMQAFQRYTYQPSEHSWQQLKGSLATFIASQPQATVGHLIESLREDLQRLAHDLNRSMPQLVVSGAVDVPIPAVLFKNLSYGLQHLLRNSMDHGLEDPEERRKMGKEERGCIYLDFELQGNQLRLNYKDDGRGLDLPKLRRRAMELQPFAADRHDSAEKLAQLIFMPGLTTKTTVTEISGRGIGMDALRQLIEECGGHCQLIVDPAAKRPPFHLKMTWSLETLLQMSA